MKILVTGTSGFIAPRLASKLIDMGNRVWGLERYVTGRTMYKTDERINRVFGDLSDHLAIRKIVEMLQPEVVFHLAACSPVAYSYERPDEVIRTNYLGTVNLAESCLRKVDHFKHFIMAGTSEEYGNQKKFPIKETAELNPNSPYSCSKASATTYLKYMHDAFDFPMTICRPFNTYGRIGTTHFVVERIIVQCLKSCDYLRLGDPKPIRDMLYVDDHVNGYIQVFTQPDKSIGETFNFCTGIGISIKELVAKIQDKTGFNGQVVWNTIPKRPLDIEKLVGDNSKAENILGWIPKYSLDEGLTLTINEIKRIY